MFKVCRQWLSVSFLIAFLAGCAGSSSLMTKVTQEEPPLPAGKASITFYSPSAFLNNLLAPVVREDSQHQLHFVGESSPGTRFRDIVDPGEYNYMVMSDSVNLLKATVQANKQYYVIVEPARGLNWANFRLWLHAVTPQKLASQDTQNTILGTTLITPNAKADHWVETLRPTVINKLNMAKDKFSKMQDNSHNILKPEDGIDERY